MAHDAGAGSSVHNPFPLSGHSQNLTTYPRGERWVISDPAGQKLNGETELPTCLGPMSGRRRDAEPQYDQKVNNKLGRILWKTVYRNANSYVVVTVESPK